MRLFAAAAIAALVATGGAFAQWGPPPGLPGHVPIPRPHPPGYMPPPPPPPAYVQPRRRSYYEYQRQPRYEDDDEDVACWWEETRRGPRRVCR